MTNRRSRLRGIIDQYGVRLILGEVPRFYYGNDAGLFENYRAHRDLRRLQAATDGRDVQTDARAEFLRREGYLLLGKPYETALLATIHEKFQRLVIDPVASRPIGPRLREAIRGILNPLERIPELQDLLSPEISRLIRSYYGAHLRVVHVRLWRNLPVPPEYARQDVYSNLWHNDHDPVTLLRLFVYFSDGVTRETGATHFHPIPATRKIIRLGYLRRRAILPPARRLLEDKREICYFEGDIGSACLFNPQLCLHRAGVPRPGSHRDMVQFTIAPADRPLSAGWARELPADPDLPS